LVCCVQPENNAEMNKTMPKVKIRWFKLRIG